MALVKLGIPAVMTDQPNFCPFKEKRWLAGWLVRRRKDVKLKVFCLDTLFGHGGPVDLTRRSLLARSLSSRHYKTKDKCGQVRDSLHLVGSSCYKC